MTNNYCLSFPNRFSQITSFITNGENELYDLHNEWIQINDFLEEIQISGMNWTILFLTGNKFSHVHWYRIQGEKHTCACVYLCLCECVCLCLSLSVCLSLSACLCLSVSLCLPLSVSLCLSLYLYLSVNMSLCSFVSLSVCLSLSIYLSLSLCLSLSASLTLCFDISLEFWLIRAPSRKAGSPIVIGRFIYYYY